jgi:3-oxoacyl-[acyl-carrier protein] reductase
MDESDIGQLTAGALPLLDKKALVTGASRGIGASVAWQLAQAGAAVAINYRSKEDRAREVGDEILALQRRVLLLQGDITDPSDVASTFDGYATSGNISTFSC